MLGRMLLLLDRSHLASFALPRLVPCGPELVLVVRVFSWSSELELESGEGDFLELERGVGRGWETGY